MEKGVVSCLPLQCSRGTLMICKALLVYDVEAHILTHLLVHNLQHLPHLPQQHRVIYRLANHNLPRKAQHLNRLQLQQHNSDS